MGLYIQLHLLGLMLINRVFDINKEQHPVLFQVFASLGILGESEPMSEVEVKKCFYMILSSIVKKFNYYDASELCVNQALNDYLKDVFDDMKNGDYERSKVLAVTICGMGNKPGEMTHSDSINLFLDECAVILGNLGEFHDDAKSIPEEVLAGCVRRLEYIEKVLELTDVFVVSRQGSMLGAPEYPPIDEEDLGNIPDPDFDVDGLECKGESDCGCGCVMDHPLLVIEGMEDFLEGRETKASAYFTGVANANNIRLEGFTGNEGPVFEAIQELGRKAWESLTESLKAIKDLFSTSNDEAKIEASSETGDNNKKALQAMKDIPAKINDKARAGIQALGEAIDPSGKIKNLVAQLRTPADGGKVIDALMGIMSKEATSASTLNKEFDVATKSVADLKAATDAAATGDEKNKDVVAANKAKVQEKVKLAKDSLKNVKFELGAHNKLMEGIRKAIAGISPKIFIKDDEGKKDE